MKEVINILRNDSRDQRMMFLMSQQCCLLLEAYTKQLTTASGQYSKGSSLTKRIFVYNGIEFHNIRKEEGWCLMYIKRHIEPVVSRIAKRKPVLVLTGVRQVGKATMLKEVYHGINYVALNRPLVRESARENPSMFFEINKPPIVVDEIQKAAELFDYIKDIVDENKMKGQFYLTGSQSLKLMKNVSDSLAGRAGVIKLMGLSMRELAGVP